MGNETRRSWDEVADSFTTLGRVLRERYGVDSASARDATADTQGAPAASDPLAPLRQAFEQLLAAGKDLGDRAAGLVRDEEIQAQARHVAATLNGAIETTLDEIGREVRGLFKGTRRDQPPPIEAEAHEHDDE